MTIRILTGHVLDRLSDLPDESVHCVVTSPPYYGLRDYGIEPQVWGGDPACEHEWGNERRVTRSGGTGSTTLCMDGRSKEARDKAQKSAVAASTVEASQGSFCRHCNAWLGSLGLEPTLDLYLDHMVEICREIRRVLRRDGTFWLNIGDSYAGSWGAQGRGGPPSESSTLKRNGHIGGCPKIKGLSSVQIAAHPQTTSHTGSIRAAGLKPKDLMLIPSRLAIQLQDDGWWVRSEIVWAKDAPMPESCTDRPTSAHEKIWLLTKSAQYFYDAVAVKELTVSLDPDHPSYRPNSVAISQNGRKEFSAKNETSMRSYSEGGRNLRNVWRLPPAPFPDAHFATFPPDLPRRCIKAGTSERGVCPKCGAPWERMVSRDGGDCEAHERQKLTRGMKDRTSTIGLSGQGSKEWAERGSRFATIGWQPTCRCVLGDSSLPAWPIPATILDPFLGAGTTAMVADQLRRDCIGIELSPQYAEMAQRRVREDNSLFAEIAVE